jgi:hypothetical protein
MTLAKANSRKQPRPPKRPEEKMKARLGVRKRESSLLDGRAELTEWAAGDIPESDLHRSATSLPEAGRRSSRAAATTQMAEIRDSGAQPLEKLKSKQNEDGEAVGVGQID